MTLVELLCALAVVLLVSAGMVLGVSLAVRSYERSVAGSEAQVLCSTLETIVSDELRYAGTLKYDEGGENARFLTVVLQLHRGPQPVGIGGVGQQLLPAQQHSAPVLGGNLGFPLVRIGRHARE